ncbi:hypothetical protein ACF1BU_02755 [Streptomyces sp. NPDC014724]
MVASAVRMECDGATARAANSAGYYGIGGTGVSCPIGVAAAPAAED